MQQASGGADDFGDQLPNLVSNSLVNSIGSIPNPLVANSLVANSVPNPIDYVHDVESTVDILDQTRWSRFLDFSTWSLDSMKEFMEDSMRDFMQDSMQDFMEIFNQEFGEVRLRKSPQGYIDLVSMF